jgi:hypothetical protein
VGGGKRWSSAEDGEAGADPCVRPLEMVLEGGEGEAVLLEAEEEGVFFGRIARRKGRS